MMNHSDEARLNRSRRLERVRQKRGRVRERTASVNPFQYSFNRIRRRLFADVDDQFSHLSQTSSVPMNIDPIVVDGMNGRVSVPHIVLHSVVDESGQMHTVSTDCSVSMVDGNSFGRSRGQGSVCNVGCSSRVSSTFSGGSSASGQLLLEDQAIANGEDDLFSVEGDRPVSAVVDEGTDSTHHRSCYEPFRFGGPAFCCPFCGAWMWFEERVNISKRSENPTFCLCCQEGIVRLPAAKATPPFLDALLDYEGGPEAARFRNRIRVFNSMFQISSMGARIDSSINNSRGPYVFRINGQSHHRIGSLLPVSGQKPRFAQIYIHEPENEVSNRLEMFPQSGESDENDRKIVEGLTEMLDEHNVIVQAFRMVRDRCSARPGEPVRLRLLGNRNRDSPVYCNPTASEVAALVVGDLGQGDARDIIVEHRSEGLKRINELHSAFMGVQYPLLFPYGEPGFSLDIPYVDSPRKKRDKRKCITMREYYAYLIQMRSMEHNTLLRGGRLLQQFLVDAYCAIEETRLRYIRYYQKSLRSEVYRGLRDAMHRGDTHASSVGKRIILPATFTGGPRYLFQNYQDAMAICRYYGFPDLFITFTCNTKWTEILEALKFIRGQHSEDRPDIVSRVFRLKLRYLMEEITKKKHFGTIVAVTYIVEFQKRGLPHAHILVWLHPDDKSRSPAEVDRIISAEIPNPEKDKVGYDAVTEFMMHGPCGYANPTSPCMSKDRCRKYFPKSFQSETVMNDDGFTSYKRRDMANMGCKVKKGGIELDNRYVVPHNVDLVVKFEAHINVELCSKSRAIKYLFKCINKGPGRARVILEGASSSTSAGSGGRRNDDEIDSYLDCRYISAYEACWRLFAFDIHYRDPAVQRLYVHLLDEQNVCFPETQRLSSVMCRPHIRNTMFVEWMHTNAECEDARSLLYADFPTEWVWNSLTSKWTKRKQGKAIGRISFVHPAAGELYYLRMAVTAIRGAKSYEELRTVNGVLYPTFQDACQALGLLGDDREWNEAFSQASTWASSEQLRHLFVTIIMYCEVSYPTRLWDNCWLLMSDDIQYRLRTALGNPEYHIPEEELKSYVLVSLEQIFNKNGASLSNYKLPVPSHGSLFLSNNRLIHEELSYNLMALQQVHLDCLPKLNEEQLSIYNAVKQSVDNDEGQLFFVYGHGGTGKTFLWNTIISGVRLSSKIVLAVASSGIASLLLPGGRTAHSRFKIPLDIFEYSTCEIKKNTQLALLIENCSLIVWDEAPMIHRNCFEALDKTLRDLAGSDHSQIASRPFGGKTVLLGGDFRQILPVVEGGSKSEIVNATICRSPFWQHCRIFVLKTNMRLQRNDVTSAEKEEIALFDRWLVDVGDGNIAATACEGEKERTWIDIPEDLLVSASDNPIASITAAVYPDFQDNYSDGNYVRQRAIVTPHNETVDTINDYILSLLLEPERMYCSSDKISQAVERMCDQELLYPTEFLNSLKLPGIPEHILRLKVGSVVMLLRNINQNSGLCNGTRILVTLLAADVIEGKILTGGHADERVFIPRIALNVKNPKWSFVFTRTQFPVRLSYAMTINKSQGQTLTTVGLYLPKPVFTHGQLYVALSRVTSRSGLKIYVENEDGQQANRTKNIVYKEIFDNLHSSLNA